MTESGRRYVSGREEGGGYTKGVNVGDQNSLNYQDRNDYNWIDYQVIDVITWEVDLGVCASDIKVHITKDIEFLPFGRKR